MPVATLENFNPKPVTLMNDSLPRHMSFRNHKDDVCAGPISNI